MEWPPWVTVRLWLLIETSIKSSRSSGLRFEWLGVIGLGCGLGAVGLLGLHAELVDEGEVLFDGGVFGGEEFVSVEDGVRAGEEAEGLRLFGKVGATSGEADFGLGRGDAGDGDDADDVEDIDSLFLGHGGAGHGHEGVDGDGLGLWVEFGNDFEHFQAVFGGFTESEDAATAD